MKQRKGMIAVVIVIIVVVLLILAYNMFRFRSLSDESLSAEETAGIKDEIAEKQDKQMLVAYFSYSGTTRGVAEALSSWTRRSVKTG